MTTRGLLNCNPGNIRHSDQRWLGQAAEQTDPAFVTFTAPVYGIRAIAKTVTTYQVTHGCRTIRQIIDRWAPPSENQTEAYVDDVARRCGVSPDEGVDVNEPPVMTALVEAIIHHENGVQPYSDAEIAKGLALAGIAAACA